MDYRLGLMRILRRRRFHFVLALTLPVALVGLGLIFVVGWRDASAINPHPRLWLTPQVLSDIAAKQRSNDADWKVIKSNADGILKLKVPRVTIVRATNTNPVQFTSMETLPWDAGMVTFSAPTSSFTSASFSSKGAYVLRLTASDGPLTSTAEATITVGS